MELTLQSFLRFLRDLVSFFRKRWGCLARRALYTFAIFHLRFSSQNQKKRDDIRRIQSQSADPRQTTIICASRLPPPAAPIVGGDAPVIVSPSPILTQVRQPTILNPEGILEENDTGNLDVDGYVAGGSRSVSRLHDSTGYHDELDPTHVVLPLYREDSTSTSHVAPSQPNSRPSPQRSHRPTSQYSGPHPEWSQYSHHPPSEHSHRSPSNLNSAELVEFGPIPAPSPKGILRPTVGIDRYEKHKMVIVEEGAKSYACPPVTTEFLRESAPETWIPLMHPEGALYWVHGKDPIYTDTGMRDPVLRQRIEEALKEINELKETCPPLPDDWELGLELGTDDATHDPICSYYFVCHSTRCLFWLHEFDPEVAICNLAGVTDWTHIHLALQAQYWFHWEMYPHNREVPEHIVQELLGILVHAGVDCMTSLNSTTPYSEEDISKLLAYARDITTVGGNYGFSACVVGRLMFFITYCRYINFYGQRGARLTSDQTIYGHQPERTNLIKTLSIFFFYAPELYLKGLESVYTDFVLSQPRWTQFAARLQDDWKESIIYGTVLLNANVAFLAIPSVDPGNFTRTAPQLASYLSIIISVGSIVIGLLLLRQNRINPQESADNIDEYLRSRLHAELGFETIAILYSLPYSLFLWSTIAFAAAFILETLVFSHQMWTKLSVGIALVVMILLISWYIWTTVVTKMDFSALGSVQRLKTQLFKFTGGPQGNVSEPGSDAGGEEDGDCQGRNWKFYRQGRLREVFDFSRRKRFQHSQNLS